MSQPISESPVVVAGTVGPASVPTGSDAGATAGGTESRRLRHGLGQSRLTLVIGVCFAAGLAACWIIPARLAFGPGASYYTFGYIGDEYTYAQRDQPLLPGTAATNPVNGIRDERIVSQYFLEDLVRLAVSASGLNVITFIWIWRILMPLLLALGLALLARECLRRPLRPWSGPLSFAAAGAAFPALHVLYDAVTVFPPLQGFINRFPTGIEYPLSLALAWAYLRYLRAPVVSHGIALALLSALVVYLRPYATIPWGIAICIGVTWTALRGPETSAGGDARPTDATAEERARFTRAQLRVAAITLAALLLSLAPWIAIALWNSRVPAFREMTQRYLPPMDYAVHSKWPLWLAIAAVAAASGVLARRYRMLLWPGAFALALLPFISGLFPFAVEVMRYDRYQVFYLPLLLLSGAALLAQNAQTWRGELGRARARRWTLALCGASLACSAALALANGRYDFRAYPRGPYASAVEDQACLPAYRWIEANTPPEALFLVDDGLDWENGDAVKNEDLYMSNADFFSLVARRRRVNAFRMYGNAMDDEACRKIWDLYSGTFGWQNADAGESFLGRLSTFVQRHQRYAQVLSEMKPGYIFWRKKAPVPRSLGATLKPPVSACVYHDTECEIWKLGK